MEVKNFSVSTVSDYALDKAAHLYLGRRDRKSHPDGYLGGGQKWYPSDGERCWCCKYIREPSYAWPWSLNKHCRSIEHIAALSGVDETDLRRAVRSLTKKVSTTVASQRSSPAKGTGEGVL